MEENPTIFPAPDDGSSVAAGEAASRNDAARALSAFLDTVPLACLLLDAHQVITHVSQQTALLWQLPPNQLTGLSLQAFFILVGYPNLYETTLALLTRPQTPPLHFFARSQQKWLEVTARPAGAGSQVCFADVTGLQETTDRQQALQQVIEGVPDRYVIMSPAFRIEMVSEAYVQATRIPREHLVGRYVYDWLRYATTPQGEEALRAALSSFEKVLKTKRPDLLPLQPYDVAGDNGQPQVRYWSWVNTPILDPQGQVSYIIHKVNDITDLVLNQQQARGTREGKVRLQQLLEYASDLKNEYSALSQRLEATQQIGHIGSFEWTRGSQAPYFSDELYRIYGLEPQSTDMTLPRILQFAHPEDREKLEEAISHSQQQPRVSCLSHRINRSGGEVRFLNWQFESFADAQGQVDRIRGTVQDLTEQKRTDLILDAIKEVCFELDENLCFIYANRQAYTSWNKAPDQVLGQQIWELFPRDRDTQLYAVISQVAATRRQVLQEMYYPAIQGWILVKVYPSPAGLIVLYFEVTEQVEARHRLLEQQAQYQALGENIPDVVTRWDRHLNLVYANSAFWERTGLPRTGQLDQALQELDLPEEVNRIWREKLNQVFATGQALSHYYAFPSPAGIIYFLTQVVPERGVDGSVQTVLAMAHDITDLKEAEAEVIRSKALLQSVLDAAPNAIALARAVRNDKQEIVDFEYVYTNQGFAHLLGREVAQQHYLTSNQLAQDTGILAMMKKVVYTGQLLDEEICYRHAGGHKWFRLIAVKLDDGVVANFTDISLRKGQEEAIAKHLSILQQSEHLARMGSWEYDVASGTFLWSEGMYRLFGLSLGTAVSPETYRDFVQEKDRDQAETLIRLTRQDQQPFEGSLQMKVRGRRKIFRIKSVVVPDTQGLPAKVLGLNLDVTELQRLEQENLAMKLQAQKKLILAILEAQETERKRIAEALHNGVGQLLYATRLHLSHLRRSLEGPAGTWQQVDQLLDEAIRETRRLSHELVPAILEDLGLMAALEDIARKYSSQDLDLECRVSAFTRPLPKHLEVALFRIAQELANNIVKHAKATKASIQIRQQDRYLALLAEDNGTGFSPGAGTDPGMGLKAIRDRVNLLNGTMTIDSRPGLGTLISIYLPFTTGA